MRAPTTPVANPQALFASARASLKHAGTPTEAPINPAYSLGVSGGRRAGKPTVGLQPDKMADFLKESGDRAARLSVVKPFMQSANAKYEEDKNVMTKYVDDSTFYK